MGDKAPVPMHLQPNKKRLRKKKTASATKKRKGSKAK